MSDNVTNTDEYAGQDAEQATASGRSRTRRGPRDWWHNSARWWQRWLVYLGLIVFALVWLRYAWRVVGIARAYPDMPEHRPTG